MNRDFEGFGSGSRFFEITLFLSLSQYLIRNDRCVCHMLGLDLDSMTILWIVTAILVMRALLKSHTSLSVLLLFMMLGVCNISLWRRVQKESYPVESKPHSSKGSSLDD